VSLALARFTLVEINFRTYSCAVQKSRYQVKELTPHTLSQPVSGCTEGTWKGLDRPRALPLEYAPSGQCECRHGAELVLASAPCSDQRSSPGRLSLRVHAFQHPYRIDPLNDLSIEGRACQHTLGGLAVEGGIPQTEVKH